MMLALVHAQLLLCRINRALGAIPGNDRPTKLRISAERLFQPGCGWRSLTPREVRLPSGVHQQVARSGPLKPLLSLRLDSRMLRTPFSESSQSNSSEPSAGSIDFDFQPARLLKWPRTGSARRSLGIGPSPEADLGFRSPACDPCPSARKGA